MTRRRTGVALLVVGLAVLGVTGFVIGRRIWHQVFATTYAIPGAVHVDLGAGRYVVYERTGHSDRYGPVTVGRDDGMSLSPANVEVRDATGRAVAVDTRRANQFIDRNDDRYTAALEFDAPHPGAYSLTFRGTRPGRVIVARSIGHTIVGLVPWAVGALIGAAAVFSGLLTLLLSRRRAPVPAGSSPPQWVADPYGTHRLRYWDGTTWTDHVAE